MLFNGEVIAWIAQLFERADELDVLTPAPAFEAGALLRWQQVKVMDDVGTLTIGLGWSGATADLQIHAQARRVDLTNQVLPQHDWRWIEVFEADKNAAPSGVRGQITEDVKDEAPPFGRWITVSSPHKIAHALAGFGTEEAGGLTNLSIHRVRVHDLRADVGREVDRLLEESQLLLADLIIFVADCRMAANRRDFHAQVGETATECLAISRAHSFDFNRVEMCHRDFDRVEAGLANGGDAIKK